MANRNLYQLIISQLADDGYYTVAQQLSNLTMIPCPKNIPENRLSQVGFLSNIF